MKAYILVTALSLSSIAMEEPSDLMPLPLSEHVLVQLPEACSDHITLERLQRLMSLAIKVSSLPDGNVHVLDGEAATQIENLNALSVRFNLDDYPDSTLAQVGELMIKFVDTNPDFFSNFSFASGPKQSVPISPIQLKSWLSTHFSRMDSEVSGCPGAREVWSRAWSLASYLQYAEEDWNGIRFVFDAVVESYATGGGCIQGRINRGLIAYAKMLTNIGIRI